jgi:FkbM family methyltransferase
MFAHVAHAFDRAGLRTLVARAASLAYSNQRFRVDADGYWVNEQSECTIVSPTINTMSFNYIRDLTLYEWCRDYVPEPGDTVLDLGSGVGEQVVVMSKLVGPTGEVVAVEAHPVTFRCLEQTIAASRLSNVSPIQCAVADSDGTADIGTGPNHLANSILEGRGFRVPQLSLETLCRDLPKVDFLRCNIEGAERLAIQGPALGKVRNLCIECHDFIADSGQGEDYRTLSEVSARLEVAGFDVSRGERDDAKPWLRYRIYAKSK